MPPPNFNQTIGEVSHCTIITNGRTMEFDAINYQMEVNCDERGEMQYAFTLTTVGPISESIEVAQPINYLEIHNFAEGNKKYLKEMKKELEEKKEEPVDVSVAKKRFNSPLSGLELE